jgi:hypothetical protein
MLGMGWVPKISDSIETFGRVCGRCEKLGLTESFFIARRILPRIPQEIRNVACRFDGDLGKAISTAH